MSEHSVIGLFCDDLRMERSGQETIVGVLPDNINVPSIPGAFPKLCLYVRLHLDLKNKPKAITFRLDSPDELEHPEVAIENEVIESSYKSADELGHAYAGIISRTIISPFSISQPGPFQIIVSIDGDEIICGSMFVKVAEQQSET